LFGTALTNQTQQEHGLRVGQSASPLTDDELRDITEVAGTITLRPHRR
jgi:hypothetical protein